MRIRKLTAIIVTFVLCLCCLLLYRLADRLPPQEVITRDVSKNKWVHVKDVVEEAPAIPKRRGKLIAPEKKQTVAVRGTCSRPTNEVDVDIRMEDVYKELRFDNPDGGVWKQGWPITVDQSRWTPNNRLQVFVVPHSHNDPGWIKTFDDYYISQTRNILNSLLAKLSTDPRKKFIWAEISFFSLWWDELSDEDQSKVKRLVENGQLEIVTGGWVMNDEANAHYYSIITQLTEGHQWVKDNLGVTPKNSWCIDPFGKSSTMPYILRKMGLENLVIQRVHYSIKKHFAQTKNLEFRWRQLWDAEGSNELMTHMMPFYSYDVPHTCGPDPKICCQFDFKRLPGHGLSCPWKEPPRPINPKNVAARANMLLEQYKKKAELYRTNVILIPLGDDFRYEHSAEWDNQFENYYKIFEYFNSHPELHVDAKFGTLQDFFTALMTETTAEEFPSLHGDFFTYADRDDHYWSGYFTSRPFHKRMDRVLMSHLRAAEILYALSWGGKQKSRSDWLLAPHSGFLQQLRDARRALSLFQHHDAVAGTGRDNVMEDYGRRMLEAIGFSHHVIQQSTHFLLTPQESTYHPDAEQVYFDVDDHRRNQNSLPERKVLIFREGESKRIVIFNSLARRRQEAVSVHVFKTTVSVTDSYGSEVPCQINPVFAQTHDQAAMVSSRYELWFVADLPPLGLASYTVTLQSAPVRENTLANVTLFNAVGTVKTSAGFESVSVKPAEEFSLDKTNMRLVFTPLGNLKSVTLKDSETIIPMHLEFVRYGARQGSERSGAYLFLPAGEAVPIRADPPLIRIITGPIVSRAEIEFPNVRHTVSLYSTPGPDGLGLEIANLVDLTDETNYELAMRISTHIQNLDQFYTDLNGMQMTKRKRYAKLPLQANIYPIASAIYIEDDSIRLTVATAQPLGGSSLREGQLEIMQDRRLQQDDNRGMGQGVLDNKPSMNLFRLYVEQRSPCKEPSSLLSVRGHEMMQSQLYPPIVMIWRPETSCDLSMSWTATETGLQVDLELESMRTLDAPAHPRAGLVFHRTHLDTCFLPTTEAKSTPDVINLGKLLPDHFSDKFNETSLSFLHTGVSRSKKDDIPLCHMDFLSITLSR